MILFGRPGDPSGLRGATPGPCPPAHPPPPALPPTWGGAGTQAPSTEALQHMPAFDPEQPRDPHGVPPRARKGARDPRRQLAAAPGSGARATAGGPAVQRPGRRAHGGGGEVADRLPSGATCRDLAGGGEGGRARRETDVTARRGRRCRALAAPPAAGTAAGLCSWAEGALGAGPFWSLRPLPSWPRPT